MDNGQAESLFYRHLDFDYKTNSQYDNPSNPVKTLPDSLYLTSKPAFFGSRPWPWVNPAGKTNKVYASPAKVRYDGRTPIPQVQVTSISPVNGPIAGGTRVTIRGNGFVAGATVTVGGVAATGVG